MQKRPRVLSIRRSCQPCGRFSPGHALGCDKPEAKTLRRAAEARSIKFARGGERRPLHRQYPMGSRFPPDTYRHSIGRDRRRKTTRMRFVQTPAGRGCVGSSAATSPAPTRERTPAALPRGGAGVSREHARVIRSGDIAVVSRAQRRSSRDRRARRPSRTTSPGPKNRPACCLE